MLKIKISYRSTGGFICSFGLQLKPRIRLKITLSIMAAKNGCKKEPLPLKIYSKYFAISFSRICLPSVSDSEAIKL